MHTTRCLLFTWCAILAVGATRLSAQPGGEPPPSAVAPGGGRPLPAPGYQGPPPGYPQGYAYPQEGAYPPGYGSIQDCEEDDADPFGLGLFNGEGRHHRLHSFGSVDFLIFFTKPYRSAPLVTTSPANTPEAQAGVIAPGNDTRVLVGGNNDFGNDLRIGGRAMVGKWFDSNHWVGGMARFTMLDNHDRNYHYGSAGGDPIIAEPFTNISNPPFAVPTPDSQLIGFADPNFAVNGTVHVQSHQQFHASDALLRAMMIETPRHRVDLIFGYHYARIDSALRIQSNRTVVRSPVLIPGTVIDDLDQFSAHNEFHGGTIGFTTDSRHGRWSFSTLGKVSYGSMWQRVWIDGSSTANIPNVGTITAPGSLYTAPSNIGTYHRHRATLAPEMNLNLTRHFAPNVSLSLGYSFIYYSHIQSVGDAVDSVVDFNNPPGTRPGFAFQSNDFWAMGSNVALNWDY